ncbi:ferredoxin [Hydrococcus rivularis NIES-593]|uniref:Ferredoxin n=1 Tax=Hydrococcus rivularis NIES-593 TaxID=1921803 RepID=A0A1U7HBY8_9CYAN|nr:2Fe-2S iron-sulfur cluster-binding protein [Hydrococcus rivularis]OKH21061.1 ferredoxin [Hydrococcus rivularis NIES-593]
MNDKTFSVTLVNEAKGTQEAIQVPSDQFILDAAQEREIELPYSCRAGSCFDCLGKVVEGKVEQTGQALSFLKSDEIKAGFVLLCSCSPASDCTILTHQAEKYLS